MGQREKLEDARRSADCSVAAASGPQTDLERFVALLEPILAAAVAKELFGLIDQIALTRYEELEAAGSLILCPYAAGYSECDVRLVDPHPLSDPRGVRKYLEVSGANLSLLSDGRLVFGFAQPRSDPAQLVVRFHGSGIWDLRRGRQSLVRRAARRAPLAVPPPTGERLRRVLRRTFAEVGAAKIERLVELVHVAEQQQRGTNVLISADASAEASRLRSQCTPVIPVSLSAELMRKLSSIDGTVILDVDGRCHAIGAILDGEVDAAGSRARGGRYNSAVMYVATARVPGVIVVVSRDGGVDLVATSPSRS